MARLIDPKKAKEIAKAMVPNPFAIMAVNAVLDWTPGVDAVEVVHAYWTGSRFNPITDEYEEYCSHCCAWSSEYGKPYCPNCGAKMDGGNQNG